LAAIYGPYFFVLLSVTEWTRDLVWLGAIFPGIAVAEFLPQAILDLLRPAGTSAAYFLTATWLAVCLLAVLKFSRVFWLAIAVICVTSCFAGWQVVAGLKA
jgi:hypothetical protein